MISLYVFLAALAGVILGYFLSSLRNKASGIEPELRRQIAEKDAQIAENRARENNLIAEKSAASAERDAAREGLAEKFKAISAEALEQNRKQLFSQNQDSLLQRQEAIKSMLTPLEEHLKTYQQRLQQSETTQSTALGKVNEQLATLTQRSELLAKETEQFRGVLRSNQARGRWGEETLRRVVEAAGMSAHCDFTEQAVEGDAKPDMVVHLPGNRLIIVDAKTPDLDFLTVLESADLEKRKSILSEHAVKMKSTIKGLADRDYPAQFQNSLDYVVLFLPAESLFSAALEGDRDLIVWAAGKKIMLATPASLIALLRAVSMNWDHFRQSENTREILIESQSFYERVATFFGHFGKIRENLAKANDAFNASVGSYERMVRPQGEKLGKLGVSPESMAKIEPLETSLRLPFSDA